MKTLLLSLALVVCCHGMAAMPAGAAPRVPVVDGLPIRVSHEARDLIVHYEVGGRSYYERLLQVPTYPGGASGVTIGFGYDLGYNTPAQIRADWGGRLPASMVDAMVSVAGLKGSRAANEVRRVRAAIRVPWEVAQTVFEQRTMPRFARMTQAAFPAIDTAHPHGQGVLLSLVFNRGASMAGESRREMRWVRDDLRDRPARVPGHIRAMKRLWLNKGLDGLLRRREAEAALFEKGNREK